MKLMEHPDCCEMQSSKNVPTLRLTAAHVHRGRNLGNSGAENSFTYMTVSAQKGKLMEGLQVQEGARGCTFAVHVLPRSRRDAVLGLYGGALRICLRAPAEEGRANEALRAFLAQRLGVPVSAVELLAGHTSRRKLVRVAGVTGTELHALLQTG